MKWGGNAAPRDIFPEKRLPPDTGLRLISPSWGGGGVIMRG